MTMQPTGPRGMPVIGALPKLRKDALGFLQRTARDYGDVVPFRVGPKQTWLISDPALVEEALVRQKHKLHKDVVTHELSAVLGNSLLTSEGDDWKRQRRLVAPAFTPRRIANYADSMVHSTRALLPDAGPDVDIHGYYTKVTLHIVLRTLFGTEPTGQAERVGAILDGLMASFETENRTLWRLVPGWVPGAHRREVDRLRDALDTIVYGFIDAARKDASDRTDLLARLLATTDEHGDRLGTEELRDQVLTLFLAGHETTALALSFTTLLLAEHPEHQQRLRQELDDVTHGDPLTLQHLEQLPFLRAVWKEGMRLFPPAWAMGRQVIEPVQVGGVELQVGDQVAVSPWVIQRDPRWWVGASRFRPDRWLNGETDDLPRFAYLPFGAGPRVCVGQHFAEMELGLVLGTVMQARQVSTVPGYRPDLVPAVTLRSRSGVRVAVS